MATWTCCGTPFETEAGYVAHRALVHGEKREPIYTCCGTPFYTDQGYREHRQRVHGEAATPPEEPAAQAR